MPTFRYNNPDGAGMFDTIGSMYSDSGGCGHFHECQKQWEEVGQYGWQSNKETAKE